MLKIGEGVWVRGVVFAKFLSAGRKRVQVKVPYPNKTGYWSVVVTASSNFIRRTRRHSHG